MKILMVCLGNICRSPLAEALLRHKIVQQNISNVEVDSAGTSAYHINEMPDKRMIQTALSKGVDMSRLRARQFCKNDFDTFDYIYVMDKSNYENVLKLASSSQSNKVLFLLGEVFQENIPVPDPYFGGEAGFLEVFSLIDQATDAIIANKLQST
jgi:protein-tyrosine phosphatase